MSVHSIRDYGAVPDGLSDNAAAIQRAIDECYGAGGGQVVVPAGGVFRSGPIVLKSNVELHLERGATLLASGQPSDYTSRVPGLPYKAFISAAAAENVAIAGAGTIDFNGRSFIAQSLPHIHQMKGGRPRGILLHNCQRVSLNDVTLRDGPVWTLHLSACQDVLIHAIRIYNDLKLPNNDGIDLDRCRNVRISDCHIECGDDCICVKTMKESEGFGPSESITVRGCTLVSTSGALIIGCEARAVMRDIVFDSCIIKASHRGLAVHLSEEADVENVLFSNMVVETRLFHHKWWGRAEPIYVTAIPWTTKDRIGQVRNVRFVNVLARGENGVYIQGWEQDRIENLLLENVRIEVIKTSKWRGGTCDIRPSPEDGGGPGAAQDLPVQATAGFFIRNARNVTLRNCQVAWGAQPPEYFHHALEAHNVAGLVLEGFAGESAHPERYAAIVRD
jgi:Glycosyl hydrolases family 28